MITWRDVLLWAETKETVYAEELAKELGLKPTDAAKRLQRLRRWGYLRYADRKKRGWGGFLLTDYAVRRMDAVRAGKQIEDGPLSLTHQEEGEEDGEAGG